MAGRPRGATETAALRRQQALDLRLGGLSYRAIGEQLSVSHVTAFRHVAAALDEVAKRSFAKAEVLRDLELSRLDALTEALWTNRDDDRTARALIAIVEQRAKLLGLYPKQQVGISSDTGGPVTVNVVHHYEP